MPYKTPALVHIPINMRGKLRALKEEMGYTWVELFKALLQMVEEERKQWHNNP